MKKHKKLILIGSSSGAVHLKNYYDLIKDFFDDILIITNSEIDFCNFKVIDFGFRNPISIIKSIKTLNQIYKDYQPSVIHVHQANSYGFISIKANKDKFPLVLTTWGSDVLLLPNKNFLFKKMVSYNLRNSDYITADASFMREAIHKIVANKKVEIINFGIDFDDVELIEKENIIYSNRLHNDLYNIDDIIIGFSKFVKSHPDWKLIVGANGKNTDSLKVLAESILPSGAYEFIGFVNQAENKRQYLRAKVWVSIPSSDGTAISLLEAMGYGCIPVLSDLPANNEWIVNNKNGIIVKNNLVSSLCNIEELSLDSVQDINKKLILSKATKQVNKNKFESIYKKILND